MGDRVQRTPSRSSINRSDLGGNPFHPFSPRSLPQPLPRYLWVPTTNEKRGDFSLNTKLDTHPLFLYSFRSFLFFLWSLVVLFRSYSNFNLRTLSSNVILSCITGVRIGKYGKRKGYRKTVKKGNHTKIYVRIFVVITPISTKR